MEVIVTVSEEPKASSGVPINTLAGTRPLQCRTIKLTHTSSLESIDTGHDHGHDHGHKHGKSINRWLVGQLDS